MVNKFFKLVESIFLGIFLAAAIFVLTSSPTYLMQKAGLIGPNETIFGAINTEHKRMTCKFHSKNKEECSKSNEEVKN